MLYKAIASGKEHREEWEYKKNYCKTVDKRCRNHGDCEWCKGNRLYNSLKKLEKANYMEE